MISQEISVEGNGFSGGMTYSFESPKVFDKLLIPEDAEDRKAIEISNPLGEDFSIMRTVPLKVCLHHFLQTITEEIKMQDFMSLQIYIFQRHFLLQSFLMRR